VALDRQDILLLLIAGGASGRYEFDPIRAMKGCFIVHKSGRPEWRGQFAFRPYDYGPFDPSVYRARDALVQKGLVAEQRRGRYGAYSPTEAGQQRVEELRSDLSNREATWLERVGRYVTSRSFTDLLDEIYERFPEYAERSVYARPT
jgi:hypothetical protein